MSENDEQSVDSVASLMSKAVAEISEKRHQILDDYCKVILAKKGGDERAIRDNMEKMVLHCQEPDILRREQKWWVTFDAKMSCGDWRPIESPSKGEVLLCIGNGTEKRVVIGTYMSKVEREKQSYLVGGELWRALAWMPLPSTEGLE